MPLTNHARRRVRVPVVMQMEVLECGAACLSMVLSYHGKWLPIEELRRACGVSRDGVTAAGVVRAARKLGLNASGHRCEIADLREAAAYPCVLHWGMNHFVVLTGFSKRGAHINDPARGQRVVSFEELDEMFTGIRLEFAPSEAFERGGKPASLLSFLREKLSGSRAAFAFALAVTAVLSVLSIVQSTAARAFVDNILTGENPEWLRPFLVGVSALSALMLLLAALDAAHEQRLSGKLAAVSGASFFDRALRLPVSFFQHRLSGDLAARQRESEQVAAALVSEFAPLLLHALMMAVYLVVMTRYSLPLTLVGVGSVAVNVTIGRVVSARRVNVTRVLTRDRNMLDSATVTGVRMIETIKASGGEQGFLRRWAGLSAALNTQTARLAWINQCLGALPSLVTRLANLSVLLLGVLLSMEGKFTIGMILAFQGFLSNFSAPAGALITAGQHIQEMRSSMERIDDVMRHPPAPAFSREGEAEETASFEKLRGRVELRGVTFGYAPYAEPVIRDVSLTVEPGRSVALVGPSGCGKSTVAALISGLYEPWDGEILFDGRPIREIPRPAFTGSLAVVDQDIVIFEDTIAGNIRLWDPSIEDFEVILASRDAGLHDEIMQRDGGYQSRLQEGGRDLSGGQRQRLEIARVLAQDPTVVVLDEATSALDAGTEADVIRAIRDRGVTRVVIAHRLSTVRDCDEIVVLEQGRVAERGTHEALLSMGGVYSRMVLGE